MKAFTIASANLRRLARSRTTLFFTLALPVVLILVIGLATQGFEETDIPVGVVRAGDGELARHLAERIDDAENIAVLDFDDVEGLRRGIRRGVVSAGIVVGKGYDDALASGREAEIAFLADISRGFPANVRAAAASAVADQGQTLQAARFATANAGGDFATNLALARDIAGTVPPVGVGIDAVGPERVESVSFGTGFGYQAPANLILFVFITSIAASALLIETRRLGVSRRMLGTPTTARTILAGEALGRFVIAAGQALFIYLAGSLVFGVDWGDPLGAFLLILLFVLVGTAVGMLFGTVFRTPEQAAAIGPPVGIALGMLGGCMWPLEIVPEPMNVIGHLFPHAWAMDAWIDLTAFRSGVAGILPELAVLSGFVVILLPLATWRLRRAIVR